ncbi:zinc ABC transporter [Bacteroides reticulotermitis JCM 10512]|uniref:Zinc ABC transporter n=1 Tax=Bacteroides reticulotermitis JCM 10512 TaxID=1445607 RepID=W4UZ14_9BACE|nr:zinc ABC transporter [Bacteroides reticulotermitis JCM 10512]
MTNQPGTNMKPLIEIRDLSAGYEGRQVLRDVNLTVYERDFLGVIGPNGGGKTTLIKCILGLLKPTGGKITFHMSDGTQTTNSNDRPTLGYLPQYNTIDRKFPISVEEVILSGLSVQQKLYARFTHEQREKGRAIIERMGLEGLEKRAIGQLSGGQLQRALLGRAIISDPSVVILDEPSTYIDKRFEARLYELLAEINNDCAIILVSHDIGTVLQQVKSIACVNESLDYHPIRASQANGWRETSTAPSNCWDTARCHTASWVSIITTITPKTLRRKKANHLYGADHCPTSLLAVK